MPDVTLVVRDLVEPENLERALKRLGFVNVVNADAEKGLVAVSYEGGPSELERIKGAVRDAGYEPEHSPGADSVAGG